MSQGNGIFIIGGVGLLAYLTRDKWLTQVENVLHIDATHYTQPMPIGPGTGSGATPTTSTGNQPISIHTPGAVPVGDKGCFLYPNGTAGGVIMNCPPGVNPPTPTPPANNCSAGFTLDAAGVCTRYPDAVLLASLNTIPWTGLQDIPAEQINRIDPQILAMYSATTGVTGGTVLAYMLGVGGSAPDGTIRNGSDGYAYKSLGGIFYRQGTSTASTLNGIGRLGNISRALPITNATLIMASANPDIARLVGRDQRAMLTAAQWNAYYTQATGIAQGIALHPEDMRGALMSAEQYQARRALMGLQTKTNLGTLRPVRRGAFPLGGLGQINQWVPPGNRTIFQIPGRGAVPAGRGGRIPPPRKLGLIEDGGGNHRWARSPFPRPSWWREA